MKTIQTAILVGNPDRCEDAILPGSFVTREKVPRRYHEKMHRTPFMNYNLAPQEYSQQWFRLLENKVDDTPKYKLI